MAESLLQATIESHFDNVWLLGVVVKAVATQVGFSFVESLELELAVVEALNNSIEHAYEGRAGHKVELSLQCRRDALELTIADEGLPIPNDCSLLQDWGELPEDAALAEGGRGIAIIKQVMDSVRYSRRNGRNELQLVKRLRPSSLEHPPRAHYPQS